MKEHVICLQNIPQGDKKYYHHFFGSLIHKEAQAIY
jgi:hypothetical protein